MSSRHEHLVVLEKILIVYKQAMKAEEKVLKTNLFFHRCSKI